ncbi:MAG: hypothetical protein ABSH39_23515 [Candidatus Acidiferrum sp.]
MCRNFIAGGDALGEFGEELVRQAGFGVWFEDYIGNAAEPGCEHHGAGGIASHPKGGDWLVFAEDAACVEHCRGKHREIFDQRGAAFAFEAGDPQRFQRETGLGHQLHFQSAFCSYQHSFSFLAA